MSKEYEHSVSNEIHDTTASDVKSYRCGYSGNSKFPQPDVLVTTPVENHAMEIKGPIQSDVHYVEEDDLEQLVACQNSYTIAYLVIKFSRYEPLVVRYYNDIEGIDDWNDLSISERFSKLAPPSFDSTVTDEGNVRFKVPRDTEWSSTAVGREDHIAILDGLAVKHPESTRMESI